MVLRVMSNWGDIMPPRIFSKGLKIKTKEYLKDFEDTLDGQEAAIRSSSRIRHLHTTEGGYRTGAGRTSQNSRRTSFQPPSSLVCNTLENCVWGTSELQANKIFHNSTDSLVQKIKEAMGCLDRDTVAKTCK
jgi:hypothetical protein